MRASSAQSIATGTTAHNRNTNRCAFILLRAPFPHIYVTFGKAPKSKCYYFPEPRERPRPLAYLFSIPNCSTRVCHPANTGTREITYDFCARRTSYGDIFQCFTSRAPPAMLRHAVRTRLRRELPSQSSPSLPWQTRVRAWLRCHVAHWHQPASRG